MTATDILSLIVWCYYVSFACFASGL